ncbi:MAG: hypothetical protein R6X02_35820 [Enhygromyxa sp.]
MNQKSDTRRVWAGRLSVAVAVSFVVIGALRFATDTLHEFNHDYWQALSGTPFRYLVRAPSDGTLAGSLNAQFFKIFSIPAGLCLVWLGVRFGSGTLEDKAERFRDLAVRGTWTFSFLAGFTLIELEKSYHFLGMNAVLVAGERAWLNHVVHLVSAVLAWGLTDLLAFEPLTYAEIALERELDALEPSA